jgi:hypothetical protein
MNKKIKKFIMVTTILALGLSILSGCAGTKAKAEDSFASIEQK